MVNRSDICPQFFAKPVQVQKIKLLVGSVDHSQLIRPLKQRLSIAAMADTQAHIVIRMPFVFGVFRHLQKRRAGAGTIFRQSQVKMGIKIDNPEIDWFALGLFFKMMN